MARPTEIKFLWVILWAFSVGLIGRTLSVAFTDKGARSMQEPETSIDVLLPRRKVAARYGVAIRTIRRWESDPSVKFPETLVINKRRYYRLSTLVPWERARAASSVASAA
jgi:hypothetical protein